MSSWLSDPGFWGAMRLFLTLVVVVAVYVVRRMTRRRARANADGRQR